MKATSGGPVAQALAQLELERDNLAARLEKVNALIASMRDVFHLPHSSTRVNRAARETPPARTNGHGTVSAEAIREALHDGPLSPGVLADRLGIDRARLRYRLVQLETSGVIVSTGVTAARRVALPGAPAKEVP